MNNKKSILLLFPEYSDNDNIITSKELVFEGEPAQEIVSEKLKNLGQFIEFFQDENFFNIDECELFVYKNNVKACRYLLDTIPEEYPSMAQRLNRLLSGIAEIEQNSSSVKGTDILASVGKEGFSKKEIYYYPITEPNKKIDARRMTIKEVYDWICDNRFPKRIYHWNPKHGMNNSPKSKGKKIPPHDRGSQNNKKVSPLLGSDKEAEKLLVRAIGTGDEFFLFAYDDTYNCYMEFKIETKNQADNDSETDITAEPDLDKTGGRKYHSYHLILTDNQIKSDIPENIRKKLALVGQKPKK